MTEIFDKKILKTKWERATRDDFIVLEAAEMLGDKLADIKRNFRNIFEVNRFHENISENENKFDLVTSSLHMHWINDFPGVLSAIQRVLQPDGFFIANMFGGETLKELRDCFSRAAPNSLSPRISPMLDIRDLGMLLQLAKFNLPVADVDKIEVSYENVFALMHHLRKIGETNSLIKQRKNFTGRNFMNRVAEIYKEKYSDSEGRIIATYEIITISGWKPDKSQQQPLKPGSAKAKLYDALQ